MPYLLDIMICLLIDLWKADESWDFQSNYKTVKCHKMSQGISRIMKMMALNLLPLGNGLKPF